MSFIEDYSTFTEGNECPNIYHTWSSLSAISHLVSRQVWIEQGVFTVRPNMYVLLVGPPGIKKSTAMKISRKLVHQVGGRKIAPSSITKEAITQVMSTDEDCKKVFIWENQDVKFTHYSVFANELTSLLSAGGSPVGMIDFLTDIWDLDVYDASTKNKGNDYIEGPYITLLGCMTPETMKNFLFQSIISGGFTRRCIFVYDDRNGPPCPRPIITEKQEIAWDRCIEKGKRISQTSGAFSWGTGAQDTYDEWYKTNHAKCALGGPAVMQGFYQSKGEYVLKVAMLLALSETEDLILLPEHILASVDFLTQTEHGLAVVFEGTGRNELSPIAAEIERHLMSLDEPVKLKSVYLRFYQAASHDEIDSMLSHLQSVGKIAMGEITVKGTPIKLVSLPHVMKQFFQELKERGSGSATE